MGLFANEGQKALKAQKKKACVLLRAMWLEHKLWSMGGSMENWEGYTVLWPPTRDETKLLACWRLNMVTS